MSSVIETTYGILFTKTPILFQGGDFAGVNVPFVGKTSLAVPMEGILQVASDYMFQLAAATQYDSGISEYPAFSMSNVSNMQVVNGRHVSLRLHIPPNKSGSVATQTPTIQAFGLMLYRHRDKGGWFTLITQAGYFENMLLTKFEVEDVGGREPAQQFPSTWRLDFQESVIDKDSLDQAANSAMDKLMTKSPLGSVAA